MENSNSISPFDLLRQRLNMPDPWILTETAAVSKRQDASRIINRIFRRLWAGIGWRQPQSSFLDRPNGRS